MRSTETCQRLGCEHPVTYIRADGWKVCGRHKTYKSAGFPVRGVIREGAWSVDHASGTKHRRTTPRWENFSAVGVNGPVIVKASPKQCESCGTSIETRFRYCLDCFRGLSTEEKGKEESRLHRQRWRTTPRGNRYA